MSEMNDPVARLLAVTAQAASFRERAGPLQTRHPRDELNGGLVAWKRLSERVEYMQIDGWHLLEPNISAALASQMLGNLEYLSDPSIAECDEVDNGIRPEYWNEKWIPIFAIEHELLCLDFAPSPEGVAGQVIRVSVDGDERRLVAPSFNHFCQRVVEAYEAGDLRFEDTGGGVELVARGGHEFFVW